MAYYLRAFCTAKTVPPLRAILAWTAQRGAELQLAPDDANTDLDAPNWQQVGLQYAPDRRPLELTVDRDDGSAESLVRAEVAEFLEEVAALPESDSQLLVTAHLRQTACIVACRLLGDADESTYRAATVLLDYFAEHCGGLIQADGEGFYVGDEVVLAVNWED